MDIVLWHKLLSPYELAVQELLLKLNHLREEYLQEERYCPMEQISGRVKSISSILDKMQKKNIPFERMEEDIEDIAGIRIICQFVEDIERVANLLSSRSDIKVKTIKDYLTQTKESGYRSYHMVVYYRVETREGLREVQVEIQIRTMAMDFWATVEHSMQYKYKGNIPEDIGDRLSRTAQAIITLEEEMSSVRGEIMDAQLSSQLRYNVVEDIVATIEKLYSIKSRREIQKIQDEFYRIYENGDMNELLRYHDQLDQYAQSNHAQKSRLVDRFIRGED